MKSTENSIDLSPTLIVEDNGPMQQRLLRLLVELIGSDAQITIVDSIALAKAQLGEDARGLAVIALACPTATLSS